MKDDELLSPDITGAKGKRNRKKKRERVAGDNKICKCETCGIEGDIAEFRSSGRFLAKNFTGKHLWQSLFLNKVAGLMPATLLKKRLWHSCFLVML